MLEAGAIGGQEAVAEALRQRIFEVTPADFEALALEVFQFQAQACAPYRRYLELIGWDEPSRQITRLDDIPHLPVELFKSQAVYSAGERQPEITFTSSGTTGTQTSRHAVAFPRLYEEAFTRGFTHFYGPAEQWSIFALLPSYLEREGSSLAYMVEHLQAKNPTRGGFYLNDYNQLTAALQAAAANGAQILLLGVAFALLDYAEYLAVLGQALSLPAGAVLMETGGMKGRRKEVIRSEMHQTLRQTFGVDAIHSEYGMTELLSQAYSTGDGQFRTPPWMRVSLRNIQSPLLPAASGAVGGINLVDLANLYSCSFLAVGDRGTLHPDGSFEVLGRIEGSGLRGCNMLIE